MIVVIDTNILLVSISPQSKHHWIYKQFLNKEFQLVVSTEILLEYEEIIESFMGKPVAQSVVHAIAYAPNTVLVTRWFCWNLILLIWMTINLLMLLLPQAPILLLQKINISMY